MLWKPFPFLVSILRYVGQQNSQDKRYLVFKAHILQPHIQLHVLSFLPYGDHDIANAFPRFTPLLREMPKYTDSC